MSISSLRVQTVTTQPVTHQLQQAQQQAIQARQKAENLQIEAEKAQQEAEQYQEKAGSLQTDARQAEGTADQADQNVHSLKSLSQAQKNVELNFAPPATQLPSLTAEHKKVGLLIDTMV